MHIAHIGRDNNHKDCGNIEYNVSRNDCETQDSSDNFEILISFFLFTSNFRRRVSTAIVVIWIIRTMDSSHQECSANHQIRSTMNYRPIVFH